MDEAQKQAALKMLGTGALRGAGEKLSQRDAQINRALEDEPSEQAPTPPAPLIKQHPAPMLKRLADMLRRE